WSTSLAKSDGLISSYKDASVFNSNSSHTSDIDTNLSNASNMDLELDDTLGLLGGSNLPPEFFLRMQDDFKEEDADDTAYCKYIKQDPKYCMQDITLSKINAFFHWLFAQKTGAKERRLPSIRSSYTLKQYWKEF
ncbi:uncharacterized protein B0J16DRAFT_405383, partial [Fusarium flagelliforme]|uniref:uncharacterized protein n=1 Tax=Fusarium flagelliforme TaxID=2675880 RepID=UPI001E8CE7A9